MKNNGLSHKILKSINTSDRPLSTMEIVGKVGATREMIMARLQKLHLNGRISGRDISAGGQGVYIWWRKDAFGKVEK